jgi:hypothetical protein
MKEATDIDSIMEEIAHNLNEKAYKMLEAPFHEAAEWFNSLSEEQFAMLDEKVMSQTGATQAPAQVSMAAKQQAAGQAQRFRPAPSSAPTTGADTGGVTGNPMSDYNPGQVNNKGQNVSTPTAVSSAPQRPVTPTPAPSTPRTSERVASQQANVPDSRNLRTAVKPAAGEGTAGKALAAAGVSRADRLNPAFLKSQGITAKPGSAEANMALRAKMQSQRTAVANAENPKSAANAPTSSAMRPGQNVSGMRRGPTLGGGVRE